MKLSEFDIIKKFFSRPTKYTLLSGGDDCALVAFHEKSLAMSTDMLVAGTHFFEDTDPYQLGHKALAVNLSDMAAMGATPHWVLLTLALPEINVKWLEQFSAGFYDLAGKYEVDLIGGDTTRGHLSICVHIIGEVDSRQALRRDRAQVGDEVWVSGKLGDAALALAHLSGSIELSNQEFDMCVPALLRPSPRVELGLSLIGVAHAAIDISDGLVADLGHIAERSGVAATIIFDHVPKSKVLSKYLNNSIVRHALLSGGDDYELCFTAPNSAHQRILELSRQLQLPLSCIGSISSGSDVTVLDAKGNPLTIEKGGFDHFN